MGRRLPTAQWGGKGNGLGFLGEWAWPPRDSGDLVGLSTQPECHAHEGDKFIWSQSLQWVLGVRTQVSEVTNIRVEAKPRAYGWDFLKGKTERILLAMSTAVFSGRVRLWLLAFLVKIVKTGTGRRWNRDGKGVFIQASAPSNESFHDLKGRGSKGELVSLYLTLTRRCAAGWRCGRHRKLRKK